MGRNFQRLLQIAGLITFCLLYSSQVLGQKAKKIKILKANSLQGDENKGVRKLIGDVGFEHEGVQLFCDSAYLYTKDNSVNAYGHVHIMQGDSINMYGDSLVYNGDDRIAHLRHNITVLDKNMKLTTDYLDYDRNNNLAYYSGGGYIVNEKESTHLSSVYGYYYPKTKHMHYKKDVVLTTSEYTIKSDTLVYNTISDVTYFIGPSDIVSKENHIYCENGWYNTNTNQAQFSRNARIQTGSKTVTADSIFYDRNKGIGQAFCNVSISDTIDDVLIYGDYALDKDSISMVTDNVILEQLLDKDTLYIHADTLLAGNDSSIRMLRAFYHVKFYMKDFQGKCDSLVYSDKDSTIRMYREPVLWSDENQMTADYIEILKSNNQLSEMYMYQNAFIASEVDSTRFDQIKGKDMISHFKDNKLHKVNVNKNGQTIYYARGDSGKFIGMNKADCQDLVIIIDSNEIRTVTFLKSPTATLYPLSKVNEQDTKLEGLHWFNEIRPLNKDDVFIWGPIPRPEVKAMPEFEPPKLIIHDDTNENDKEPQKLMEKKDKLKPK